MAHARPKNSRDWVKRHLSDPYVKRSQEEGFRSRSVYKLTEIDANAGLIKPGMTIVDLGSGVAVNYVPPDANGSPSTRHQPSQLWAKGGDCYGRRKELKIRPARDYVAFAASHPSVDCADKRVSPDGQTQAEARILGRRAGGKWKGDLYSFGTGVSDSEVYEAVLELSLSRGGTQVAKTTSPLDTVAHVWGSAIPCWSHDSQTVAWKLTIKSDWKRDPLHSELVLVRTASPRK